MPTSVWHLIKNNMYILRNLQQHFNVNDYVAFTKLFLKSIAINYNAVLVNKLNITNDRQLLNAHFMLDHTNYE